MLVSNFDSKKHPSVKGAVDYVFSNRNHKGETRPNKPELLKGDEFITRQAGYLSAKFSNQRTSGVIAFAKGENPTREEMLKIIDNFEETFFGNMKDRVAPLYVLHKEEKSSHIHYVIPNVDLETGKAYNPFPPGKMTGDLMKAFSALENHNNGWKQVKKNPLKPAHTKTEHKAIAHKNDSKFFKTVFIDAKSKDTFEKSCLDLIRVGEVKNRDELISFLKDNGYTFSRIGKDYLSIAREGQNFRLKGGIFAEGADYKEQVKQASEQAKSFDPQKVAEQINRLVALRNAYNEKRYQAKTESAKPYIAKPKETQQSNTQAPRTSSLALTPPPINSAHTSTPGTATQELAKSNNQDDDKGREDTADAPAGAPSLAGIASAQSQLTNALAQLSNAKTPKERAIAQMAVNRARGAVAQAEAQFEQEQQKQKTGGLKL